MDFGAGPVWLEPFSIQTMNGKSGWSPASQKNPSPTGPTSVCQPTLPKPSQDFAARCSRTRVRSTFECWRLTQEALASFMHKDARQLMDTL